MRNNDAMTIEYIRTPSHIDAAITAINAIAKLPDDDASIYIAIRNRLIDDSPSDNPNIHPALAATIHSCISLLESDSIYARHALSDLCLNYSLCPLHRIDYAICFDDRDSECANIRICFPIHDS